MRIIKNILVTAFAILCIHSQSQQITIKADSITDKIRGGLLGQMIGVLNGLPHEMKYDKDPGSVENYVPSLPDGAWTDDDTDFEWVYICEMQKKNKVLLSYEEITALWKERINRRIWCANRYARYLIDIGIEPPLTGSVVINPWAEFNLSGQFLCETFALLAPGMPQTASKTGLNYTLVAISQEPAQTTQFFCSMIATAFIENDINRILDAGLKALDEKSIISNITNDVREWHRLYPNDWKKTRILIQKKYTQPTWVENNNGHVLNTAAIIASLLYGNGDFALTLQHAFNYGWDADCNAATAGTIVGVLTGYRNMLSHGWKITDRYRNETRDNMPMDETITGFADRLIDLFELINEQQGGSRIRNADGMKYIIKTETPAPIVLLKNIEEQRVNLAADLKTNIIAGINSKNKDEQARGAYLAVSMGLDKSIKQQYPKQWKSACYSLSGYWKIMNNIFYGSDFKRMNELKDAFAKAGFKAPVKKYTDDELYNDAVVWKDPKVIY